MKNKYLKPVLAKYGNSLEVIQGDCGWGGENLWLDKTGAKKRNIGIYVTIIDRGPIKVCKSVYGCSEDEECN